MITNFILKVNVLKQKKSGAPYTVRRFIFVD